MSIATLPAGMDTSWAVLVGLLALRVAATFMMTPVLYAVPLPATVRVLLVLSLSVALASALTSAAGAPVEWRVLLPAALSELVLGAVLGLGILLAFGAFTVAGQMLDVQLGFGIAQIMDPVTRRPVPILTTAFAYVAVLVFFLVNGHHALLRGIAYSVERFPVGAPWSLAQAVEPVLKQAAGLFSLGFALAAPVVFCILLAEFALGVVGRNLPQMNMFTMGIPVKIIVGLVALSLWFTGIGGVMTRVYAGIATTWDEIFVSAPPQWGR
ncbi:MULTISPECIES: flagellar biosynthetic protein FliR [Variovorax]|uniref:flagellar biosynthetic protein FliR n=1 Tax=Variovorax TaxID=34072 RepID=UPI00086C90B4|nr:MULTISPECIES: flagellar biosynthetic protein FliR [Variovorax]ODU12664.1 MAG: flagellar biosynthetic protein FliR [Variovorax sp. SCN 67-85]ODV19249.1 MAG: flagellar biosynthetic protein FliR [Variovorax sp. SCN 67-20]OJZ06587.1 MAG: flagellar biosynthetic protein FliR [Variovorax sp. 67-131]UKI07638.1 flagellar biosynthetic protein FliR [Variovorax paradoxus]